MLTTITLQNTMQRDILVFALLKESRNVLEVLHMTEGNVYLDMIKYKIFESNEDIVPSCVL